MAEMTNERKVSILENLLLERDKQIKKLQSENAELKNKIESFGDSMQKLQGVLDETRGLKREFLDVSRQMKLLKKHYERDLKKI